MSRIAELEAKVAELESQKRALEFEKAQLLKHSSGIGQHNQQEVDTLRSALKSLKEERNKMTGRLAEAYAIDNLIVELYLEMRDRSYEDPAAERDLENERASLAQQSSLVVLDLLRAELQSLKAFKEDYENELKGEFSRRKSAFEIQNEQLRRELTEVKSNLDICKGELVQMNEQLKAAQGIRDRAIKDKILLQERLDAENFELKEKIRNMAKEIELLKEHLTEKDAKIKDLELKHNSKEFDTRPEGLKRRMTFSFPPTPNFSTPPSPHTKPPAIQSIAEKPPPPAPPAPKGETPPPKTPQLNPVEIGDYKRKIQKLSQTVEEYILQARKADSATRKAKSALEEERRKNQDLKKEINILKQILHKKQEAKSVVLDKFLEFDHSHVEVYKKLLKEKDKEAQQLNSRLKRMTHVINKGLLLKKSEVAERQQMFDEIQSLRGELATVRSTASMDGTNSTMASTGRLSIPSTTRPTSPVEEWVESVRKKEKDDWIDVSGPEATDDVVSLSDEESEAIPFKQREVKRPSTAPGLGPKSSSGALTQRTKQVRTLLTTLTSTIG